MLGNPNLQKLSIPVIVIKRGKRIKFTSINAAAKEYEIPFYKIKRSLTDGEKVEGLKVIYDKK